MKLNVIKNEETTLVETDAPLDLLLNHITNEYLNKTDLKEYLEEMGYTYKEIKASLTLNYDEV